MLSSLVQVMLVLSVIWSSVSAQQPILPFLCQIYGCGDGTCNTETGKCACDGEGVHNYDCTEKGDGDGDCYDYSCGDPDGYDVDNACLVGDEEFCMCVEGYHDESSCRPRIQVDCEGFANGDPVLDVTIAPYYYANGDIFKGIIYIRNNFDDNNAFDDSCLGFRKQKTSVSHSSSPNGADCAGKAVMDGGEVYTYVYLQHNPDFRSQADHLIKLTCSVVEHTGSSGWEISVNEPTSTSMEPLESTIDTGADTDTTMQLMEDNGGSYLVLSESINSINIGDDLSLVLTNDDPFVVRSCTASNFQSGEGGDDYKELKLIDDGCVPADYAPLIRGVFHGPGDDSNGADSGKELFRLDFDAFSIIGPSRKLYMRCVLCFNHCELQNPPTCDNGITSYEEQLGTAFPNVRRRRDVSDDVISSRHRRAVEGFTSDGMEVSIQIGSATNQNTSSTQVSRSDDLGGCYKSVSVLLPLSLLTVLLLVAMVMAFYFCTKLTTGNGTKTVNDHVTHKS